MELATVDSFFFKRIKDRLIGFSGTYVDDIIKAGKEAFRKESNQITVGTFNEKLPESLSMTFTGLRISGSNSGYAISQKQYIENLEFLPRDTNFEQFRSMRTKLDWVVNTRHDFA